MPSQRQYDPPVENVRAIITTRWKNAYRPLVVRNIESYFIDSSLDNDADNWHIEIGDPDGKLLPMLKRDNEVRVELIGIGKKQTAHLVTGIADEISYDDSGVISVTGRDLACLALDSYTEPRRYAHAFAWSIIYQQARELGYKRTSIQKIVDSDKQVRKKQMTDGSETYWEFWYRLVRKEKTWLWCTPNGTLVASQLNYAGPTSYYFGIPPENASRYVKRQYIPVESCEIKRTSQARVGEIWVYGAMGDRAFITKVKDPTTQSWLKRPRKFLRDATAGTPKEATKAAWDDIFEGKVGNVEISLTIAEPGYMIKQNRVAYIRIPGMGFAGRYFVVGVRMQASQSGLVQEVRLRELQYALPRRFPNDPQETHTSAPSDPDTSFEFEQGLDALAHMPENWGSFFYNAANEFHGGWDFNLFLATLIAICYKETGIRNIRQHGVPVGTDNIEWYPKPAGGDTTQHGVPEGSTAGGPQGASGAGDVLQWQKDFVNEAGMFGVTSTVIGVGPMQLTTQSYKDAADAMDGGHKDQFGGNRWDPESNIFIGAKVFAEKLKNVNGNDTADNLIWGGVAAYNGSGVNDAYTKTVQKLVMKEGPDGSPGYLAAIGDALDAARTAADAAEDGETEGSYTKYDPDALVPPYLPTEQQCIREFQPITGFTPGTPGYQLPSVRNQKKIVAAAMYEYYNRDQIPYIRTGANPAVKPPPYVITEGADCSSFAQWCYLVAGCPDPGENTYSQWKNGRLLGTTLNTLKNLVPGDLCFYTSSEHVVVFVGVGRAVSHGGGYGPIIVDLNEYRLNDFKGARRYPFTS